jgi:hypothetical protein
VLIGPDSPLKRPPALPGRERLFLDGLRYAIQTADLSFFRLCQGLMQITVSAAGPSTEGERTEHQVGAVLDAWSMIDSIDRLRGLLNKRGHVLRNYPPFNQFVAQTAAVRKLRNSWDHLPERIDFFAAHDLPVHGTIGWVATLAEGECYVGLLKAGTLSTAPAFDSIVNPGGKPRHVPIGLVTLTVGKDEACLSDVFNELASLVRAVEPVLKGIFGEAPPAGGDLAMLLKLQ